MKAISLFLVVAGTIDALQSAFEQCGGAQWTGDRICVDGYHCSYETVYFSQCVPESADTEYQTLMMSGKARRSLSETSTRATTSFAQANGNVFTINGQTEYFMGTNCYWCGFLTLNSDIDKVMSDAASSNLKVVRVWGFNIVTSTPSSGTVWYQSLIAGQDPAINTGVDGLQRLDYLVASAEAHGISLIVNFVNNWGDYGGMPAYQSYYGISHSSWYTSSAAQATYQEYIATVVSRYDSSPAIFAWELANEPRCSFCSTSTITDWVNTTSSYIKSLDPNHMVCVGDEGFGTPGVWYDITYPHWSSTGGYVWADILALPNIDFGTFHLYPSQWFELDSWGPSWIDDHATAAQLVGKPAILEEYGSKTHVNELPWQAEVMAQNIAGDMYWQFGDTLSTGNTSDDGYTIYYGTAEYAELVTTHAAAMLAKAV